MFDVVALGESLIDFTPNGTNAQGIESVSYTHLRAHET